MSSRSARRLNERIVLAILVIFAAFQGGTTGQVAPDAVHQDLQRHFETQVEPGLAGLTQFTFGVTGDIHLSPRDVRVLTRAGWESLLAGWRDAGHQFGLIVGDLGFGEPEGIADVVNGWAAVPGAPPIFYTMGNHELDPTMGKRRWIDALYPGAVNDASWTTTNQLPGNSDGAYWGFNVGPFWRFIILDGDQRTPQGAGSMGTLGRAQLDWLAADLYANPTRNVMVFLHEPIDQPKYDTAEFTLNDRGPLLDVLAAHPKQKFLFAGHLHSYRGITRWRGVTTVHTSEPAAGGVSVSVNGETANVSWTGMTAADTVDYDQHPMYQVTSDGVTNTLRVGEEGGDYGRTRSKKMTVVGPENGVTPTHGSLMLKAGPITWYDTWFISEQLVKIVPGMKFSYDVWLHGVSDGMDAVVVQPSWVTYDGLRPPLVTDQNGLALSQHTRDNQNYPYYTDLPRLGGLATGRWYRREIDLTPLAGSYADGVWLAGAATNVNVGTAYVDNIRFTWPVSSGTPVDTVPPMLSAISTSGAASGSITISWTTDEPSTSQVDYGTTPGYGSASYSAAPVFNHSVTLSGLAAETHYYFRVRSRDSSGNLAISSGYTFVTEAAPPGPTGLLAHWPLDEADGVTAADIVGAHSGTLINGPSWTTGRVGGGVRFDGVDDYISVPDVSVPGNGLTITAWVNSSSLSATSHQRFVSKATGAAEQDHVWMLGHTSINGSNRLRFRLKTGTTTSTLIASVGELPLNTWYHAAATYDGTTMRLYLNGAEVGAVAKTGSIPLDPSIPVHIGRNPDATNHAHGMLDDLRIYNRGLTPGEIGQVMQYEPDLVAPIVSITSPASGSTVSGVVPITAAASDNAGAVASVQFFVNGVALAAPDTTAPFSATWDATGLSGSYTLTATAKDASGNAATSAPVTVTVGSSAPSVAISAPSAGLVRGTITVSASASDPDGIAGVRFQLDGVNLGTEDTTAPYSISWNTTTASNGTHTLTAIARDTAGNLETSAPVTVTVDNLAPAVSITAPAAGPVGGTITISANATDAVGIASVQFQVDGADVGAADTTAPYSISWNTTAASNGAHTIGAVARDLAGNVTTSSSVNVTVSNWAVPAGLVAAYAFDDGSGSSATDASGNNRTGTLSGGATWTSSGRFGGAINFNGSSGLVTIADHSLFDFTSQITIEAWVRPTVRSNWDTIVMKPSGSSARAYALYSGNSNGNVAGTLRLGSTERTVTGALLTLNTWTHVAMTYNGSIIRLYVNGTQVATRSASGSITTSGNALTIGGSSTFARWFAGTIDEVRFYNRALSQSEIQAGMNQTVRP